MVRQLSDDEDNFFWRSNWTYSFMNHKYCAGGDGEDNDENKDEDLNVDWDMSSD